MNKEKEFLNQKYENMIDLKILWLLYKLVFLRFLYFTSDSSLTNWVKRILEFLLKTIIFLIRFQAFLSWGFIVNSLKERKRSKVGTNFVAHEHKISSFSILVESSCSQKVFFLSDSRDYQSGLCNSWQRIEWRPMYSELPTKNPKVYFLSLSRGFFNFSSQVPKSWRESQIFLAGGKLDYDWEWSKFFA